MADASVRSESTEPELTAPPRSVKVKFTTWIDHIIFLTLLAASVTSFCLAGQRISNLRAIETNGKAIDAVVMDRYTAQFERTPDYYVSYSYVAAGKVYTGNSIVPEDLYNSTPLGGSIAILYLPSNPSFHYLSPVTDLIVSLDMMATLALCLMVLFLFFRFGMLIEFRFLQHAYLLRHGIPVSATVTSRQFRFQYMSERVGWFYIECAYTAGLDSVRKWYSVPFSLFQRSVVGSILTVLVDPNKPANSLPYRAIISAVLENS